MCSDREIWATTSEYIPCLQEMCCCLWVHFVSLSNMQLLFYPLRIIVVKQHKEKMFMYFCVSCSDKNNLIGRTWLLQKYWWTFVRLMKYLNYINLISDGTRINDNKYLESLVTTTELIACIEEQIQKMLIYYE